MMLRSVSDLALQSSKSPNILRDMLTKESHYLIDENGTVAMWGADSFDLNCKSMDFSYYPYDKHKCEFLIHSDMYTEVNNGVLSQNLYTLRKLLTGPNDIAFLRFYWYGSTTSTSIQDLLFKAARKLFHSVRHVEILIRWILHSL